MSVHISQVYSIVFKEFTLNIDYLFILIVFLQFIKSHPGPVMGYHCSLTLTKWWALKAQRTPHQKVWTRSSDSDPRLKYPSLHPRPPLRQGRTPTAGLEPHTTGTRRQGTGCARILQAPIPVRLSLRRTGPRGRGTSDPRPYPLVHRPLPHPSYHRHHHHHRRLIRWATRQTHSKSKYTQVSNDTIHSFEAGIADTISSFKRWKKLCL